MVRVVIVFLAGISVGAVVMAGLAPQGARQTSMVVTPAPISRACENELAEQKARIKDLEGKLGRRNADVVAAIPAQHGTEHGGESHPSENGEEKSREALSWRVSAIEKFVPLNEEQKNRLVTKFEEESRARQAGDESKAEKLEEILGEENARYYREQVKAAFERVQNEENEKEVLWISRQLNLSADQEQSIRSVFLDVERVVEREFESGAHGSGVSPQERVKAMIAENKRRRSLREEKLQGLLSPDQYQAYLRTESESAASDVEVFHDPGK